MAWTCFQFVLAGIMVATGSINTLTTKWADELEAEGIDGVSRKFSHPFVQAAFMFLGEIICLAVYELVLSHLRRNTPVGVEIAVHHAGSSVHELVRGNRFNPFIFYIPAFCDMLATSLMYVGLTMTYASSFQMLRGSVIIFVAILSIVFLQRKIELYQWIGMFFVVTGLIVVGTSDFLLAKDGNTKEKGIDLVITGDSIIVFAQLLTAIQMVYEEKFISSKDIPPLKAVGWEGVFGFATIALLLIPFNFIPVPKMIGNNAHGTLEDTPDAAYQISNNFLIGIALLGTAVSIAFFNFAGVSVTKELSATTRMILDSVRTLVIWVFSLAIGWARFHYLQVVGFILLIFGMMMYNNLIPWSKMKRCCVSDPESQALVGSVGSSPATTPASTPRSTRNPSPKSSPATTPTSSKKPFGFAKKKVPTPPKEAGGQSKPKK